MKKIILLLIATSLVSCFEGITDKIKKTTEVDKTDLRYYADKTVNNLEVPPDLTNPNQRNALNIDKFIDDDKNLTTFDEQESKLIKSINNKNIKIEVKRDGLLRWLVVAKNADYVWKQSQEFLKDSGFRIMKSDQSLGILETNFLENKIEIPNQNLGLIRSMFKNALGSAYVLPTLDKYRIRLEALDKNTTEIYLTMNSMREVVTNKGETDENTIWQEKEVDKTIETEMLYRLMVYLGSDKSYAKAQIETAQKQNLIKVKLGKDIKGFAKLQFDTDKNKTWDALSVAFDKLNIEIDDRDKKDLSIYINVVNQKKRGIMSKIFGDNAIKQNFQIKIREVGYGVSDVYFIDISNENKQETKDFSKVLFTKIAKQF